MKKKIIETISSTPLSFSTEGYVFWISIAGMFEYDLAFALM